MITKNSHMNPVYGKEEVESVNEYINSGGWIMNIQRPIRIHDL